MVSEKIDCEARTLVPTGWNKSSPIWCQWRPYGEPRLLSHVSMKSPLPFSPGWCHRRPCGKNREALLPLPAREVSVKLYLFVELKLSGETRLLLIAGISKLAPSTPFPSGVVSEKATLVGKLREFPCGPVVRTWCFHCCGLGSIPCQGTNILQVTWLYLKRVTNSVLLYSTGCVKSLQSCPTLCNLMD